MSAIIEMIGNLIKDGFTITIAPAQGIDYFDQPIPAICVTTSKDGVSYGEGSQPDLAEALEDAYTLTPTVKASIRAELAVEAKGAKL